MTKILIFLYILSFISLVFTRQTWLQEVSKYSTSSTDGYAGLLGKPMTSLRVSGGLPYRVHILGGNWLSPVTGNNQSDPYNGYAGLDSKPIDGVSIKGVTYRVHLLGGGWLDEITKYDINDSVNGVAGIYGKKIDAIMIKDRVYASAYISDNNDDDKSSQEYTEIPKKPSIRYNRNKAVSYARKYAHSINHKCGSHTQCSPVSYWGNEHCGYEDLGGDCANFVSQCLVIGGGYPKLNNGTCRGYPCGFEEIGAKKLAKCLIEHGWKSVCGHRMPPPSYIKPGDVLIYHKDSCTGDAHAVIVTTGLPNVKISCHSSEKLDVSYKYMDNSGKQYYQWIHYIDDGKKIINEYLKGSS